MKDHTRALVAVLLLCCTMLSADASAELVDCNGNHGLGSCENGSYPILGEPEEDSIGLCSSSCSEMLNPLPTPVISCLSDGLQHYCEVWPRSEFFTYSWRNSEGIPMTIQNHSTFPFQEFSCDRSPAEVEIEVSITNLWGLRSSSRSRIFCEEAIFNPSPSPGFPSLPSPEEH